MHHGRLRAARHPAVTGSSRTLRVVLIGHVLLLVLMWQDLLSGNVLVRVLLVLWVFLTVTLLVLEELSALCRLLLRCN